MQDFLGHSVFLHPPRARSGQPTLSREQIVKAALELLDAEGEAGLSMRKLGTRLGAGATSMYWHVANKDQILELAVDEVFGEVYVPEPGDTPWRVGLSIMANGIRAMVLRHPWITSQMGVRPTIGPKIMKVGDRSIALLAAAGFTGAEVTSVLSLMHAHAIGAASAEAALLTATKRAGSSLQELTEQIEPYVAGLSAEHPHYEKWRHETEHHIQDPARVLEESFTFGLDRILDGLEVWLARP
jgi:AcrR family transcriptional regulator